MAATTLNETEIEALWALVAYNYADEAKDYESSDDEEYKEGHIFLCLQTLKAWLDSQQVPSGSAINQ